MTDEEKRASCHITARLLIEQTEEDCRGTAPDFFLAELKWRIGEMLHEKGLSWDCYHQDAIDATRREL